jgi:hypothetical protein
MTRTERPAISFLLIAEIFNRKVNRMLLQKEDDPLISFQIVASHLFARVLRFELAWLRGQPEGFAGSHDPN